MRLAGLLLLAAHAFATEAKLLEWMNAIAQQQLADRDKAIAAIATVSAAEERKKSVRAKVLESIGGLPDYDGPLNPRVTGTLDRGEYVIENVIYESLPRIWITANLYRPKASGRYPGVLVPMGHWDEGKAAAQRIAANLALKGFVVLAFDPLGQGERQQAFDQRLGRSIIGGSTEQHFMAGAQSLLVGQSFARYRIWDAKRSLDYLISRPEVDAAKIGCTGCSGGGTLTTFISALDDRIKVAAPACYMQSFKVLFKGPVGDSEQSLPDFLSGGLDQTDFVELFAPKPWLILNTEKDYFTPPGARIVYEEARRWYGIYGQPGRIKWVVGPGGHGTPLMVREALYDWMIRWLKDGEGDAKEASVELVSNLELRVTPNGQVEGSRDIFEHIRETPRRPGTQAELLAQLRRWTTDKVEPAVHWVLPAQPATKNPAILYVDTRGGVPAPAKALADRGYIVLVVHPRGTPIPSTRAFAGDWSSNTRAWLIGRNLPGMRAQDILAGLDLLAARPDVDAKRIGAVAHDVSGIWLLMAAAQDQRFARVWLDGTPHSLRAALDTPVHQNLHDAVLPGFALRWDLNDLVTAIGARKVVWSNPADWMRRPVRVEGTFRLSPTDSSSDAVWMPPGLDERW